MSGREKKTRSKFDKTISSFLSPPSVTQHDSSTTFFTIFTNFLPSWNNWFALVECLSVEWNDLKRNQTIGELCIITSVIILSQIVCTYIHTEEKKGDAILITREIVEITNRIALQRVAVDRASALTKPNTDNSIIRFCSVGKIVVTSSSDRGWDDRS